LAGGAHPSITQVSTLSVSTKSEPAKLSFLESGCTGETTKTRKRESDHLTRSKQKMGRKKALREGSRRLRFKNTEGDLEKDHSKEPQRQSKFPILLSPVRSTLLRGVKSVAHLLSKTEVQRLGSDIRKGGAVIPLARNEGKWRGVHDKTTTLHTGYP